MTDTVDEVHEQGPRRQRLRLRLRLRKGFARRRLDRFRTDCVGSTGVTPSIHLPGKLAAIVVGCLHLSG